MSIGDFELLLTAQGLLKQCLSQDPKSFNMELETNHEPPRPEGQENNSAMIPYVIRKLSVGENVNKLEEREDEIKVERMKDNKGSCHLRFSGFCPLRGYPPPYPLNGKSV